MLHAFGSNARGQLSLGHLDDAHTPTPCTVPSPFPTTPPSKIVAGGNHSVLLFPNGTIFAAGDNTHNQCCLPSTSSPSLTAFHPIPAPTPHHWKRVSAGWNFSVLVSDDDRCFASGEGAKGELGLGGGRHSALLEEIPNFPPAGTGVLGVTSGMAHTLVVLGNGEVWGWGAGRKGQLGEPRLPAVSSPRRIGVGFEVGRAECGREFSVLVDKHPSGRIVFLGNDKYGIEAPLSALVGVRISDIQASWNGVYILESSGILHAWGKNDRGQLPPSGLCNVQEIAVGSEHVLATHGDRDTDEKRLVAWGWGEHGNCGRPGGGNVVGEAFELKFPGRKNVTRIGAGCATSWVWVE